MVTRYFKNNYISKMCSTSLKIIKKIRVNLNSTDVDIDVSHVLCDIEMENVNISTLPPAKISKPRMKNENCMNQIMIFKVIDSVFRSEDLLYMQRMKYTYMKH